ncbi:MAG: ROK family protein [Caulobacterales bacterium]|nr:ROK family protein [Caulobacterales bacterium]
MADPLVAGIDAGGTSWKIVIARGPDAILARHVAPTRTPEETIGETAAWLEARRSEGFAFDAVGLASFGPVDRDPASPRYGEILDTPKPGWTGANARATLERRLGAPCVLDTDVNGALLAETSWGGARGCADAVYITIGTGVGGGVMVAGRLAGAPFHPELGHARLRRSPDDIAAFPGACPRHGDCVEGLVAAPAIRARWGEEPHALSDDHPAWEETSVMLARLSAALTYTIAPQRIVLGGGLMQRAGLIERVRRAFETETDGYGLRPEARTAASYLVTPGLGGDAGAFGGVVLAQTALAAA